MDSLTEQREATASPPTTPPRSFDFPTLNGDGSVPDLIETHPPPGQRTPPAALSTLALKMDHTSNSLDDGQYDMVDDALSNDGETASIASTTDDFEDDIDDVAQLTPDETGSVADDEEPHLQPEPSTMLSSIQLNKARLAYEAAQKQERQRKEEAMDSFLSEDLETPRQSTINRFPLQHETVDAEQPPPPSAKNGVKSSSTSDKSHLIKVLDALTPSPKSFLFTIFLSLISLSSLWLNSHLQTTPADIVDARREALSTSLVDWEAPMAFNIEHLLPMPVGTNSTERKTRTSPNVPFQGLKSGHIVISLPSIRQQFPQPQSIEVTKSDSPINFTERKLIDGVHGVAIDFLDAYGLVTVKMACANPSVNITVSHNFGRRYMHIQKAQKELSSTVSKDVAVARKAAKGLTDLFQLELGAGVAATKNVTTQLALQMSRDLQVFANTAASFFGKAAAASNTTAQHIRKDLQLARKDLIKAKSNTKELMVAVKKEIKENFKTAVTEPLLLSRERALMLKDKLLGRKTKEPVGCKRGCSKVCKSCKKAAKLGGEGAKMSAKVDELTSRSKLLRSRQFKELKPGRRYDKHEKKQGPKTMV